MKKKTLLLVLVLMISVLIGALGVVAYDGSFTEKFVTNNIKGQYTVTGANDEETRTITSATIKMFFSIASGNLGTGELERMLLLQDALKDFAQQMRDDLQKQDEREKRKDKLPV